MKVRIQSTFDCLTLISQAQEMDQKPTHSEVYLLAYLASLMAVYAQRKEQVLDWGYSFTATPSGFPFSNELDEALNGLIARGEIEHIDSTLQLTESGSALQKMLSALSIGQNRIVYLDAASTTVLVIPVGMVRAALAHSPEISVVKEHQHSRRLFSFSALTRLRHEFNTVAEALDTAQDSLLAALVLWINYPREREGDKANL